MELVTASDLLVTASVALLLSFLVAKLVSLAMTTDTHNTTKHQVHDEPIGSVLQEGQRLTVQTVQSESRLDFISTVQVATTTTTNVETGHVIRDAPVESDSEFAVELPPATNKSDIDVDVTKEKTAVQNDDDSSEQRNAECVEEITEENSSEKVVSVVEREGNERDEKNDDDDDWEWEGIERSELEKVFMVATEFVAEEGCGGGDDDVEMELYGLHKVATEGPCREPQPMPLKLSARAKWNAWQKLGNTSPEVAMERYISILSDKVPGWMKDTCAEMTEREPSGSEVSESAAPDLSSSLSHQQMVVTERELEPESSAREHSPLTESDLENNVKN